jgi:hypothetical protein
MPDERRDFKPSASQPGNIPLPNYAILALIWRLTIFAADAIPSCAPLSWNKCRESIVAKNTAGFVAQNQDFLHLDPFMSGNFHLKEQRCSWD